MKLLALKLAASRAMSALIGFAGIAFIARTHPLEVVGEINVLIAVVQVAALGLGLGLSTAIVYSSRADVSTARQLTVHACVRTLGLTIPAIAIGSMFSSSYALVALSAGLLAVLGHVAGFLQSNQEFDRQALLMVLQSCMLPAANQLALLVSHGAVYFLIAYAVVNLALALALVTLVVKPWRCFEYPFAYPEKAFYRYGLTALGHNGVNAVWYSADILLVRYGLAGDFLGIYSVAASVAKSSWIVVDSVGLIIFPRKIAGTLSDRQYRRVQGICVVYGLGVVTMWLWLGNAFLGLVFGPNYTEAFPIVLVLLVGSLAVGVYKLESRLIAATGKWGVLNIAQVLGLCLSIGAAAYFGHAQGGIGVAVGQGLGFLVSATVLYGIGCWLRRGHS